jgi:hypothetical protein
MAGKGIYDVDAMARTVWRMLISHKRLLEWSPSDDPGRYRETDRGDSQARGVD